MAHGFFSETPLYVFILVLSQVIAPLRSRAAVTSCLSTLVINRQELSVTDLEVSEDKEAFGRGSEYSAHDLLSDNTVFVTKGWSSRSE